MEGKTTFQLYTDIIKIINGSNEHGVEIEPMTDEEVGILFRWIVEYVNDLRPPVPKEVKYQVAFIKKQLDADLERYKEKCKKNSENIRKRWNTTEKECIQNDTNVYERIPNDTNCTHKDTDTHTDKEDSKESNKNNRDINISCSNQALNDTKMDNKFALFWDAYPKKIGKEKCKNWFKTHKPSDELVKKMLITLGIWKQSKQWKDPQYIPHPYTWLNQGRWDDEIETKDDFTSQSKTKIVWDTVQYTLEEEISFFKGVQKNNTAEVLQSNLEELKERDLERYYQVKKALGL